MAKDCTKELERIRNDRQSRKDYGVKGMKWGEHKAQEPEKAEKASYKKGSMIGTPALRNAKSGTKIICGNGEVYIKRPSGHELDWRSEDGEKHASSWAIANMLDYGGAYEILQDNEHKS